MTHTHHGGACLSAGCTYWDEEIERRLAARDWRVCRRDDNANEFVVTSGLSETQAKALVAEFEALGHKQHYWAEVTPPEAGPRARP